LGPAEYVSATQRKERLRDKGRKRRFCGLCPLRRGGRWFMKTTKKERTSSSYNSFHVRDI
jgi:hypothetical protein